MHPLLLLLPAFGASAVALPKRSYGLLSASTGFRLVAKVTKPYPDLSPPIDNWALSTAHTGAALNAAVLSGNSSVGRLWYQNSTLALAMRTSSILTDGGTPPAPYGIGLQGPEEFDAPVYPDEHRVSVNVGSGTATMGVELNERGWPVVMVGGAGQDGRWMACRRAIWYYYGEDRSFVVVRYVYDGELPAAEECVPVELVAQCDVLNELLEGAYSSHQFAIGVPCVTDAAALV